MPGKEKSQKRVVEHSVNKLKEVLTILSCVHCKHKTLQRVNVPSAEIPSSNSASEKGVLKDDAVKSTNSKGDAGCRQV